MELRTYRKEDASAVCGWVRDEKTLYLWSANELGKYPLTPDDLNGFYKKNTDAVPLTAVENGKPVGHLFLRYVKDAPVTTVWFGFVIIDADLRERGKGKTLIQLAVDYAREKMNAAKITLAVFQDNRRAVGCYTAMGFRPVGEPSVLRLPVGDWAGISMELPL